MNYHADYAFFLYLSGKLTRMEDVSSFTSSVFSPLILISMVVHIWEINSRLRSHLRHARRHPYHSNRPLRRRLCGLFQDRAEKMREQEVSNIVRSQLQFISLCCFWSCWRHHDAGIVPENIQSRFLLEEFFGRFPNRGQVTKIQVQKD